MYEVVKTVNGYEIKRMIGTRGYYEVEIAANRKCKMFRNFRTIKAASKFCEELPAKQ